MLFYMKSTHIFLVHILAAPIIKLISGLKILRSLNVAFSLLRTFFIIILSKLLILSPLSIP